MSATPEVSLSIVSHGQGALIVALLDDLARVRWNDGYLFEVIVTLNIPEDEDWLGGVLPFPLKIVRNPVAKGFGANHNAAFEVARGRYFAVVNPDIRLEDFHLSPLLAALQLPNAGVCGPLVTAPNGAIEDSARRFPTVSRLAWRKLARQRHPDYVPAKAPISVDWLAGMFLLFPSSVFRAIRGFDERYFMYMEDVEICRTLSCKGFDVLWVTATKVVHDASRASRRSMGHLRWHISSLLQYLFATPRGPTDV